MEDEQFDTQEDMRNLDEIRRTETCTAVGLEKKREEMRIEVGGLSKITRTLPITCAQLEECSACNRKPVWRLLSACYLARARFQAPRLDRFRVDFVYCHLSQTRDFSDLKYRYILCVC